MPTNEDLHFMIKKPHKCCTTLLTTPIVVQPTQPKNTWAPIPSYWAWLPDDISSISFQHVPPPSLAFLPKYTLLSNLQ